MTSRIGALLLGLLFSPAGLSAPLPCSLKVPTAGELQQLQASVERAPGYCLPAQVAQVREHNQGLQRQLFLCLGQGRRVADTQRQSLYRYQQLSRQLQERCGQ
ncbi:hypothetical protein [Aestuariirhabdus litorea]|uniref:Secreted protein n=1 Tax=Aestuariirhabdus litorea TaxID=2528527 RepID=A0A3P3VLI6_9GAMM|nr:hypothetical protein [Aestuariirhabdus litorea]RRJ83611.1 hypothetical protein D0544_00350 [Aestuariirhabdus litorea]RWW96832.1 hypothetical protein DZC74_00350 [Endozoicomonadaceae bacterium GTF-13]